MWIIVLYSLIIGSSICWSGLKKRNTFISKLLPGSSHHKIHHQPKSEPHAIHLTKTKTQDFEQYGRANDLFVAIKRPFSLFKIKNRSPYLDFVIAFPRKIYTKEEKGKLPKFISDSIDHSYDSHYSAVAYSIAADFRYHKS